MAPSPASVSSPALPPDGKRAAARRQNRRGAAWPVETEPGSWLDACELLELDDSGFATVLGDGEVPENLVAVAEKAVSMCPARALSLG